MDDENIKDLDYFVDIQPKEQIEFYEAVLEGLSLPQKAISPKFFYDERGSKIFDKICDTPEYYLTRTEIALLNDIQEELCSLIEPGSAVVEYGCGSSIKIKALLSALPKPSHSWSWVTRFVWAAAAIPSQWEERGGRWWG